MIYFIAYTHRIEAAKAARKASPTLTLFTSFREFDAGREPLHSYVIKNWSALKPWVRPVVFYSNPKHRLNRLASNYGWNLHAIPRANEHGTPFIKDMYKAAKELYHTDFYAYANGDLLFSHNLIDSLRAVQNLINHDDELGPPLVIGRRSNYVMNFTKVDKHLHEPSVVKEKTTKPFHNFAIDYFIIQDKFPWNRVLDMVIGRGGYDQYLVLMAIVNGMTVVDITPTNRVLHLQGAAFDLTSRTADNPDKKYNLNLIREVHKGHLPPTGNVAMAKVFTFRKGNQIVAQTKQLKKYRADYKAIENWCRNDTHMKRIQQRPHVFTDFSDYD